MITIPLTTPWNICTPDVFRYLDQQYVDAFFQDGTLRLSSFKMFGTHADEQRLDVREGKVQFVHTTQQRGGQTFSAWATVGLNAYVLCATMRHDDSLQRHFGCNSYIRIHNTTGFGMAVAKQIAGVVAAFEGPCLYQRMKIVSKDLGYIDESLFRDPSDPRKLRVEDLNKFIFSQLQQYPYFIKDVKYAHQSEYRFVWLLPRDAECYLDIRVPDAIAFCSRPNILTH